MQDGKGYEVGHRLEKNSFLEWTPQGASVKALLVEDDQI